MSDPEAPGFARYPAATGEGTRLTPEQIESIIADFRDWLAQGPLPEPESVATEPVDLHTLVAHFTALRHEVNLQTRAARQQQEQTAEVLRLLESSQRSRDVVANSEDAKRPLLTAFIEVADALLLATKEMTRLASSVKSLLESRFAPLLPTEVRVNFLGRLLGLNGLAQQQRELVERLNRPVADDTVLERLQQTLDAAASGLSLSLQRVERVMARHGLEPVGSVGSSFDSERMEAVEAIGGTGRPTGEVIEELRRGYLLDGRVLRFAQVKVAK